MGVAMTCFLTLLLVTGADLTFYVEVAAGKLDRMNEPVGVPLTLPTGKTFTAKGTLDGKDVGPVAVVAPRLASAGKETAEAWFVLPKLEAGKTAKVQLTLSEGTSSGDLVWKREKDISTLYNGKSPVLRYEHAALDETKREATFKVYHHAYSPEGVLLTKGVGGQYTHHRGLFYGFMKTTYGKETVDIWHCKGQTHQAHKEFAEETPANPVIGRHRVKIDWNGNGGKTFAVEERELAAFPLPGGTLIEFTSRLTPTEADVKLDGDPQHAGFHFRASNEVNDKTKNETIYIRPDGVGKPGTETNWPSNKKHINLPWLAMSFVVGGQRYTSAYLDLPTNPKESRFSERTYGRFGSYFVTTVTKEKPLTVRYRVWLQKGQMTPESVAALDKAFVEPVTLTVK
ncbi:MAG: hypothetical protein EBV06_00525 [Planctomycetia bacterium]|nr:hypothetical protein [Planctomycetia bacterium]